MRLARLGASVVFVALVIATGCSSAASPAKSAAPAATTASARTATVADRLEHGLSDLRSAHLTVDAGALGGTSSGEFTFSSGTEIASDLSIEQSGGSVEVITVRGISYAKLPAAHNTSAKPWVTVSAGSTNEYVQALTTSLSLNEAVGSLSALVDVAKSATSVQDKGATRVSGTPAQHYALLIDPKATTGTSDLAQELKLLGSGKVPVDLWLDATGRPVQVRISGSLGGLAFTIRVLASRFNAPVTITAPPADQVSTG